MMRMLYFQAHDEGFPSSTYEALASGLAYFTHLWVWDFWGENEASIYCIEIQ